MDIAVSKTKKNHQQLTVPRKNVNSMQEATQGEDEAGDDPELPRLRKRDGHCRRKASQAFPWSFKWRSNFVYFLTRPFRRSSFRRHCCALSWRYTTPREGQSAALLSEGTYWNLQAQSHAIERAAHLRSGCQSVGAEDLPLRSAYMTDWASTRKTPRRPCKLRVRLKSRRACATAAASNPPEYVCQRAFCESTGLKRESPNGRRNSVPCRGRSAGAPSSKEQRTCDKPSYGKLAVVRTTEGDVCATHTPRP